MTTAAAHKRDRRVLRKLDLSPEVQQAFEWFLNNLTDAFGGVRESLVQALLDGDIDPSTPTVIQAEVAQIVRGFRGDVVLVFTDGTANGANAGVELAKRRYPIEIDFDLAPTRVLAEWENWSQEAVDSSLDTLTREVTDLVYGAQEDGLSIDRIAELVDEMMNNRYVEDGSWKARQISRSSVIPSSNAGSHAAYADAESVVAETWLATEDSRTRPEHRRIDNQTVAVGTPFLLKQNGIEYEARYAGDPTLPLSLWINERCTTIPTFPDQLTDEQIETIQGGGRVYV